MKFSEYLKEIKQLIKFSFGFIYLIYLKVLVKHRCVVIEEKSYHHEVLPAVIRGLNGSGYAPLVFMEKSGKKNEFLKQVQDKLKYKIVLLPRHLKVRTRLYKFMVQNSKTVWNTLHPKAFVDEISQYYTAKHKYFCAAVFHHPEFAQYWQGDSFYLHPAYKVESKRQFLPVFSFIPVECDKVKSKVVIGVPGNLENRRNYESLLSGLKKLEPDLRSKLKIIFFGRSSGSETDKILELIGGYKDLVEIEIYCNTVKMQIDFNKILFACDYVALLLDESKPEYAEYFNRIMTGNIITALAANKPLIINEKLAMIYGLENASYTYSGSEVIDALKVVLFEKCMKNTLPAILKFKRESDEVWKLYADKWSMKNG